MCATLNGIGSRRRAPRLRAWPVLAALAAGVAAPASLQAQSIQDLFRSVEQGGGWVGIPVVAGKGSISTPAVPTMGMTVSGCVQVWGGHTGTWDIEARDVMGTGRLAVSTAPGESVPFTYTSGMQSQLQVDVAWSEPRDTTLLLWVGLQRPGTTREEACEPKVG